MKHPYIIAAFIVTAIILSVILGISLIYPFAVSILFSILILSKLGYSTRELVLMAWEGVWEHRILYLFVLLIGANISMWMASGIVPAIMYYGFEYLKGTNFILVAFLITGTMSIFMGTAVGTISTMGIALLGIGRGFEIPQGVLLGVLVSGAFIADKISPISGLLNLTMKVTDTTYRQVLKAMARTLIPVLVLTALGYHFLGQNFTSGENGHLINYYQEAILNGFRISPYLLILPLAVVLLPLLGVKTVPTILAGLGGGLILTVTLQGINFLKVIRYIFMGYAPASQSAELNSILGSDGVLGMVEVVLIIAIVIALSSLLERAGVLKPIMYDPIAKVKTKAALILKTGLIGSLLTAVTCDQAVGIVLQGKLYKDKYQELGVEAPVLARTISDTSTIIAPLIPWNINALIIGLVTGISALEYAPYAFLCFLFPLWTMGTVPFVQKIGQKEPTELDRAN